ncbi:MAG: RNA methyltransferase [Microthrixaceae bacterium]
MRRLSGRRTARYEADLYLIDGPVLLAEAIESGVEIEHIYVEPDALDSNVLGSYGVDELVTPVLEGSLAKVLDVVNPNGMVAVARMSFGDAAAMANSAIEADAPILMMVDVADPGNVGTLLRAAEAAGCVGVVVAGNCADPFSPKVVRASAGSLFRIPVASEVDPVHAIRNLATAGVTAFATVIEGGVHPESADLGGAVAIVVGNEAHGLDGDTIAACDGSVSIPMSGRVESLNAAMAATIVLFEAARQRRDAHRCG